MIGWCETEGDAMARTLPAFIELRKGTAFGEWVLSCRACGVREEWHGFWAASYAAHGHADMHADELDERADGPS